MSFASDTFPGSAGASLGAQWTRPASGDGSAGTPLLDGSGHVYNSGSGATAAAYITALPPSADYSVQITLKPGAATGKVSVAGRWSLSNPRYQLDVDPAANTLTLTVCSMGGSFTALQSVAYTPANGDVMTLLMSGISISGQINGVTKVSATNGVITASGYTGFFTNSASTGLLMGSFVATKLTSPLLPFSDGFSGISAPLTAPWAQDATEEDLLYNDGSGHVYDYSGSKIPGGRYYYYQQPCTSATGSPGTANYQVSGTLHVSSTTAATAMVMGRYNPATGAFYQLIASGGTTNTLTLYEFTSASSSTSLGSHSHTPVNGDVITLVMNGTTLSALLNGTQVISATDSTLTAPGYAGIGQSGGSTTAGMDIGSFLVQALFTITPQSTANGSLSPSTVQTVVQGNSVSFTETPSSGYSLTSWQIDGANISGSSGTLADSTTWAISGTTLTFSNVQGDHTVGATYTGGGTNEYLTPTGPANGTLSPSIVQAVAQGSGTTFTATPSSGYALYSWQIDGSNVSGSGTLSDGTTYTISGSTLTFNNVQGNHTVGATFSAYHSVSMAATVTASGGTAEIAMRQRPISGTASTSGSVTPTAYRKKVISGIASAFSALGHTMLRAQPVSASANATGSTAPTALHQQAINGDASASSGLLFGLARLQSMAASANAAGVLSAQVFAYRLLAATVNAVGVLSRQVYAFRTLSAQATCLGFAFISARIAKASNMAGSAAAASGLSTSKTQDMEGQVTASGVVAAQHQQGVIISTTVTASAYLQRSIGITLAGAASATAGLLISVGKRLQATATAEGQVQTLAHHHQSTAGHASATGNLSTGQALAQPLPAQVTATADMAAHRTVRQWMAATVYGMPGLRAGVTHIKRLTATVTATAALARWRRLARSLPAQATAIAELRKAPSRSMSGQASASAGLGTHRTIATRLQGSVSAVAGLLKSIGIRMQAGATALGDTHTQRTRIQRLPGVVTASGKLRANARHNHVLPATVTATAGLTANRRRVIVTGATATATATLTAICTHSIVMAAAVGAIGAIAAVIRRSMALVKTRGHVAADSPRMSGYVDRPRSEIHTDDTHNGGGGIA